MQTIMTGWARSKRPIIAAGLGLALATGVAACSSAPAQTSSGNGPAGTIDATAAKSAGKAASLVPAEFKGKPLRVQTYNDYPPDEYFVNGQLLGFNPDLAKAIAAEMGLKIDLQAGSFDLIIPGLQSGRYDMGIPSFNITKDRLKVVDFVTYIKKTTVYATNSSASHEINTPMDLCGLKIGVLAGSAQLVELQGFSDECTKASKEPLTISTFKASTDAATGVMSGRLDVDVATSTSLAYLVKQSNGKLKLNALKTLDEKEGIAVPKGSPLAPAIVEALKGIIAKGEYQSILDKYDVGSSAITDPEHVTG